MAQPLSETELLKLADALADGGWHSGEVLAEVSGISRAALAKRIEKLRDWGLDLEARHGLGYRLAQPLERLDAAALQANAPAGLRLAVAASIDSTNRALLDAPASDDPQALLAELQTAGRGRRGRAWRSPFGANLYLSIAWTWPAWPPQLTTLPLAVGVTAARVLRAAGLADLQLKWPNDLRLGRDKLGGVLIEQRGEMGSGCRVVVGIGLNVAMSPAQAGAVDQPWTALNPALAARGHAPVSRNALAGELVAALHAALAQFGREGFAPFARDWAAFDATANQPVRIEGATPPLEGIARGIDADGALIVETAQGRVPVHAGEVSLRFIA